MIRVLLFLILISNFALSATPEETLALKETQMAQAFKKRQNSQFLKLASMILIENEKNLKALRLLYIHHFNQNQFGLSRIIIERSLSIKSKQAEPHLYRGLMALKENRKDQATTAFLEALKINRRYYPALVNLSSLYMQYYDYEKALPLLHVAYQRIEGSNGGIRTDEHFKIANNYAVSLVWSKKGKLAQKVFRQLRKKDRVSGVVLVNYARFLIETLNDIPEAESILSEARISSREKRVQDEVRKLRSQIQKLKRRKT